MKNAVRKTMIVIIGSVIAAVGINLAIHAGYGGATLAVLWDGVSKTAGITIGQASLLIAAAMLLISFLLDRRQIFFGTVIYQLVYSFAVDLFAPLIRFTGNRAADFLLMLLGIVIFSFGNACYSWADFGRGSYEALTFSVSGRTGFSVRTVRMFLDILCVAGGALLGGSFGVCTAATILLSGPLLQAFLKLLRKHGAGLLSA